MAIQTSGNNRDRTSTYTKAQSEPSQGKTYQSKNTYSDLSEKKSYKLQEFLPIEANFGGLIIGMNGDTIKDIQRKTKTHIKVISYNDQGTVSKVAAISADEKDHIDHAKEVIMRKISDKKRENENSREDTEKRGNDGNANPDPKRR